MSTSVKEITVCQNTFSHVEITTPRAVSRTNYFQKTGGHPNRDL